MFKKIDKTCFFFFKKILFVYFQRGEGRAKEREKNIKVWLPLAHPLWAPGLQPRHVP